MVYLPEIHAFRPGDVILTRNAETERPKAAFTSRTIREATGGSFSHAMICSTPPVCVEAIDGGVVNTTLGRCFAHDLSNIRVLRYPDAALAKRASQKAHLEVGREYSKIKALASVTPQRVINEIAKRGTFCSALVAQVFIDAGACEFAKIASHKTTPATIEKLEVLEDVTQHVFRRALAPRNIEEMSPLDGDRVSFACRRACQDYSAIRR